MAKALRSITLLRRKEISFTFFLCGFLFLTLSVYGSDIHSHELSSGVDSRIKEVRGNLLYLAIPPDVSEEEIAHPDAARKTQLHTYVRELLGSQISRAQETEDLIIIFVDNNGHPILPDIDSAKKQRSLAHPAEVSATLENELSFTFNSPTYPWSDEELTTLSNALNDFYPTAKTIYGEPAFNITVNVQKDPTIQFAGLYYVSMNEMVLRDTRLDVFCHEMIHAFRDDDIISLTSYEEGMTRAAEVEVFNQLPDYSHWDENHGYSYDVFYDGLNTQVIGARDGDFFRTNPNTFALLRYQLAGYAWAKVFLENPDFFADFNRELHENILSDETTRYSESKLLEIASSLMDSIEGKAFRTWYGQQGVLNTNPQDGYFLYDRISDFTVYYFYRDIYGETMQSDATVQWAVYDYQDVLVGSESANTAYSGGIDYYQTLNQIFPMGYTGRARIEATAESPGGLISDISQIFIGEESGIFGIVADSGFGNIIITPLDDTTGPVALNFVNGAFSAPSLTFVRGRFMAVSTDAAGRIHSKLFTKDGSNYFLIMDERDSVADLNIIKTDTPDPVAMYSELTYTITTTNEGPDVAKGVVMTDVLPSDVTFVSAISDKGICDRTGDAVICIIGEMENGEAVTVTISVMSPTGDGTIENTATISSTSSDPDFSNNTASENTMVICPLPSTPSLGSPANGIIGVSVTPTLDWDDVSDATSYRVQVCSDGNCLFVFSAATTSNSKWTVSPALTKGTTYYWRVRSRNACRASSWSSIRSFTTCSNPGRPTLVSPARGLTGLSTTPTLDWKDVSGATSYDVHACSDSTCLSEERSKTTANSQWTVSPALSKGTTYYWRVRSRNVCGTSSWSSIRSFSTCTNPGRPSLVSPNNGVPRVSTTPKLDWGNVPGATSYDVQVCSNNTCSTVARSKNVTNSQWTVSPALNTNTKYYWRVRSRNSCGLSAWSGIRNFTTTGP